jgi:hypothetical protein
MPTDNPSMKSLAAALQHLRDIQAEDQPWLEKYTKGTGGTGSETRLMAIDTRHREAEAEVLVTAMAAFLEGVSRTERSNRITNWIIAIMTAVIAVGTALAALR